MAHPHVVNAVRTFLTANWDRCEVIYPNEGTEASGDGEPFIFVQFPIANAMRVSVSDPLYREEGGIRLVLNMVRGEGLTRPTQWAEDLAALFRDKTIDRVHCGVPSSPFIDDTNDTGMYFQTALVVPYWLLYRQDPE